MAVLSKGQTFADGDDVTHTKLNNLVDAATFVSGSSGTTDDSSLEVNGSGRLQIKDSGVTTSKLGASAVTTAKIANSTGASDGVTLAKIQHLSDMTVIGNVSGGSLAPGEVSLLDEDDMASDSAISLATQQSIKAYVARNIAQQTLTGTNSVYNHASESVDPVEGTRGDDEAFWLVSDDNGDSLDVSLSIATTSKVAIQVHTHTDTNNANVGVAFKLQRSTNGGSSWSDLALGDSSSTRVRCTYFVGHGGSERSVVSGSYTYIDTPSAASVRYRVIYTCHPSFFLYLNRDMNIDFDGDAGVVSTAEYRCSSNIIIEELKQ